LGREFFQDSSFNSEVFGTEFSPQAWEEIKRGVDEDVCEWWSTPPGRGATTLPVLGEGNGELLLINDYSGWPGL